MNDRDRLQDENEDETSLGAEDSAAGGDGPMENTDNDPPIIVSGGIVK